MDRSWWNWHNICKIEKKLLFVRENFWIFGIVLEKKIGFSCLFVFGYSFWKFQKNRSQKLSMLEQKQGQIWNLHWIAHKVMKPSFLFSFYYSHDRRSSNRKIKKIPKILIFLTLNCNKKNGLKNLKSGFITLCGIQCRFQNCPCFFILALIVFDFYSFKGSKNIFYRRAKYMYKCIYRVLLLCLVAINASNQGTICSCMIFQPSCFILYFIFPMNLVVFYDLFYNDVTTLLWRHSFFDRSIEKITINY